MADIGFTALTTISTIKNGSSTASATLIKYSDGTFEFTDGTTTKRLHPGPRSGDFLDFVLTTINGLV